MAAIKNLYEEQQALAAQKQSTTGDSGVVSGAATDPNASAAQGTSWVNLGKYLDANQGLGGGVGNAVTSDSQGKIDSAAGKINEYQTKNKEVDKSQANKLDAYKTQIANDPTKINAGEYKNDTAAGYGGPTDATKADGFTDASKQYGNAAEGYGQLKSDDWANRSSAVQDTFSKDNQSYSKGMGLLDTFILQGDQKGKDSINNYVSKNASTFAPEGKDALSLAKAGVQGAFDTEKNRFNSYLGAEGSLNKAIGEKKGAATGVINSRQGQADSANALLNEKQGVLGSLAEELKKRGQGNASYTPNGSQYSVGDFATDEDRATMDALSAIGGGDYDKSLVTKTGADAGSLSYDKSSGIGKDEYEYDPATNTLKSRSVYSTGNTPGPTSWTTMNGGGAGSGAIGTWLDNLLKEKKY